MPDSGDIYERVSRDWSSAVRSKINPADFHYTDTIGSTNDQLLHLAKSGEAAPFTLCLTEHQTAGRGRRGDAWIAPSERNLLFSILLNLDSPPAHWSRIPHLIARCLGNAVESVIGSSETVQTKWPNDIYLGGKKLAGILVETNLIPTPVAIVGVGINVNMRACEFPPDLQKTATTLYDSLGCESNRWFLLSEFLDQLLGNYPGGIDSFEDTLEWLRKRDFLKGKKLAIKVNDERIEGIAAGIDKNGSLIVESDRLGKTKVSSCEQLLFC